VRAISGKRSRGEHHLAIEKSVKLIGLRYSMRALMGIHRHKLGEMIGRLESGERLAPWIKEMKAEMAAGAPCIDLLMRDYRKAQRRKVARS